QQHPAIGQVLAGGGLIQPILHRHHVVPGLPYGWMLLQQDGQPVGTLRACRDDNPQDGYIEKLSVRAELRGRGLGRALVRQALGFLCARGFHTVYLSVSAENDAAVRLYLAEGFQKTQVMVCYAYTLPA
ncbi:MAG: GNAT family N-acetyltransferase, partial [Chloroflexota bacterium]